MSIGAGERRVLRLKRHARVRKIVKGKPERPRLAVFKSRRYLAVQVIDDTKGVTLASTSTKAIGRGKKVSDGFELGKAISLACLAKNVVEVVFDRGGNLYHGRVKAIADGAREGGLKF